MFSGVSGRLSWSNTTRLLKHGIDGNELEMVDVSCTAKPCGRSSRGMMFRGPPAFGACERTGAAPTPGRVTRVIDNAVATIRERPIMSSPCASLATGGDPEKAGKPSENIRQDGRSDN